MNKEKELVFLRTFAVATVIGMVFIFASAMKKGGYRHINLFQNEQNIFPNFSSCFVDNIRLL